MALETDRMTLTDALCRLAENHSAPKPQLPAGSTQKPVTRIYLS
jgi:hypothetical protein